MCIMAGTYAGQMPVLTDKKECNGVYFFAHCERDTLLAKSTIVPSHCIFVIFYGCEFLK